MTYEIRGVRDDDLSYFAANLRSSDVRELIASTGSTDFLGCLQRSTRASDEVLVGCPAPGEKPVILWGIRHWTERSALVWACATPGLLENRTAFTRSSRPIIKRWFEERPKVNHLFNFTHAQSTAHHKWLRWCGAELLPALPGGPFGEPFHLFTIRRTKYHV